MTLTDIDQYKNMNKIIFLYLFLFEHWIVIYFETQVSSTLSYASGQSDSCHVLPKKLTQVFLFLPLPHIPTTSIFLQVETESSYTQDVQTISICLIQIFILL